MQRVKIVPTPIFGAHDAGESKIDRFCDETSILGIRYLRTEYRLWFRLLSLIIVTVCIGMTMIQVYDRISWYMKNPITIEIDENILESMPFPSITVCSSQQFRYSNLLKNMSIDDLRKDFNGNLSHSKHVDLDVLELIAMNGFINVQPEKLKIIEELPILAEQVLGIRDYQKQVYEQNKTATWEERKEMHETSEEYKKQRGTLTGFPTIRQSKVRL